ncbi:hypothetical protein [Oceanobacillus sp. CAU 1775]
MGWKSIEMQVALPRTVDAGKVQEQLQKQSEQMQGALTASQVEQEKIKRTKVGESENTEKLKLKKDSQDNQEESTEDDKDRKDVDSSHPYLGKRIDFNG